MRDVVIASSVRTAVGKSGKGTLRATRPDDLADVAIGGGTESMSMIPMGGNKVSINPWLVDHYPDSYLSMGLTAERLAKRFGITRETADEFSLNSHKKAIAAIQAGKFEDEIVPVPVSFPTPNGAKPKRT